MTRASSVHLSAEARHPLASQALCAMTAISAVIAWHVLTEEAFRFVIPVVLSAMLTVSIGAFARRAQLTETMVVTLQFLGVVALVFTSVTGSALPTIDAMSTLADKFASAMESARRYSSPVPAQAPPVHPVLIAGGALIVWVCEVLAFAMRRVAAIGIPLTIAYLAPVILNSNPVEWWLYPTTAAGYLAMVYYQESRGVRRWGRQLVRGRPSTQPAIGRLSSASAHPPAQALAIGIPAVAISMIAAFFAPALQFGGWGPGTGAGAGSNDIRIESPMTDLRRDLDREDDVALIEFSTDDPRPEYLRIAVLNRFTANAWTPGDRRFPDGDQTARGQELTIAGLSPTVRRVEREYSFDVLDSFDSTWLPTPFPASRVRAEGAWKYDRATLDFLASQKDLGTRGLDYQATGLDLKVGAAELAGARPGRGAVSNTFTQLPSDLPDVISELADDVTADASNDFEKAVALQTWFRTEGGFEYSLDAAASGGADELVSFLDPETGRVGYCEQFASAMAVMSRAIGIPARVAVGFLRPDQIAAERWVYSAWDLHAWPELYFPGAGWIRFEPTPQARTGGVPAYTRDRAAGGEPSPSAATEPTAAPSSAGASRQTRPPNTPDESPSAGGSGIGGWLLPAWVVVGSTIIGALLLSPRWLRSRRRRRRWRLGDERGTLPEAAWSELEDTAIDLGRRWPEGLSPRETRDRVQRWFDGERRSAVDAVERLLLDLESHRYSGQAATRELDVVAADVELCTGAMTAAATPGARRRAQWWPRSVFAPSRVPKPTDGVSESGASRSELLELR
ncbi:MAG: transglutaminaseTgpA domain-containing protein [Nocardioides sp.]